MIWRALEAASREPAGRSPGQLASDIVGASSCALSSGRTTPSWLRRQKSAASVSRPSVAARPSVAVDSARRAHPARAKGGSLVAMVAKGAILAIAAPKPNTSGLSRPLRMDGSRSRRLQGNAPFWLAHGRGMVWAWLAPPRLARLVRGVGGAHQSGLLYGGAAAACAVAAGSLYYSDHLERSQNNTLSEELNASEKRTASQAAHSAPTACRNRPSPLCLWLARGARCHPTPHVLSWYSLCRGYTRRGCQA